MKAVLPPFDCYSDEQWREIKNIVAELDLDADAVMVNKSRTPLCEALEEIASRHLLHSTFARLRLTPRQWAKELRDTLDEFDSVQHHFSIITSRAANRFPEEADAAGRALRAYADKLRSLLDETNANTGSWSPRNAAKPQRRAYLMALKKIWQELASSQPPQRKPQLKLEAAFLLACAAPTFAADATVIKNFLDTQHQ